VLGLNFGTLLNSTAPLLSSNARQKTFGIVSIGRNNLSRNSSTNLIIGIVFLSAVLNARYSASVVDKAISVCSCDAHIIGHPEYIITNPVRDLLDTGSDESMAPHKPLKSASAYTSNEWPLGRKYIPLVGLPFRYLICALQLRYD
jgi:hypothetical protein